MTDRPEGGNSHDRFGVQEPEVVLDQAHDRVGRILDDTDEADDVLDPFDSVPGVQDDGTPDDKKRSRPFWIEIPVLVLVALVIAVIIKTFLVQAFFIPSGSMELTLNVDDRILVNKLAWRFDDPHRGDVIVFDSGGRREESFLESVRRNIGESIGLSRLPSRISSSELWDSPAKCSRFVTTGYSSMGSSSTSRTSSREQQCPTSIRCRSNQTTTS